jgi:hypothetical protein
MNNSNNPQSKGKKDNQLIFVEYEKPTKEGHLITIVDSYHNTIGRIHRSYNDQTKKYEFKAYDHEGKPLYMESDKVWEIKNQFSENRTEHLEQAHQRRIESKENNRVKSEGKTDRKSPEKISKMQTDPVRKEDGKLQSKTPENQKVERTEQLNAVRQNEPTRDNQTLSR